MTERHTFDCVEVYADLGGLPEVAEALGVGIHRVKRWIDRRPSTNCPVPVCVLKMGHVYSISDWKGWYSLWKITRGSETWNRNKPPISRSPFGPRPPRKSGYGF